MWDVWRERLGRNKGIRKIARELGKNRAIDGIFCERMGVKYQPGQDLGHTELYMEVRSIFHREIKMSGLEGIV